MRRKLFTLAAGVSAVVCVGVCVLWVRSYGRSDLVGLALPFDPAADYWRRRVMLESSAGRMFLGYTSSRVVADDGDAGVFGKRERASLWGTRADLAVLAEDPDSNVRTGGLVFPAWSAAATALLVWCLSVRLARPLARKANGLCPPAATTSAPRPAAARNAAPLPCR